MWEVLVSYNTKITRLHAKAYRKGEKPDAIINYPVDAADYELVDIFNWQEEAAGMISQMEFVRRVDVQAETIERYVREGKNIGWSTRVRYNDKHDMAYVHIFQNVNGILSVPLYAVFCINNLEKQKTSRNMNTLPAHSLGQNPLKILDFLTSIFRLEKRTVCLSWQLVLLLQTENQYLVQREQSG